MDNPALLWVSVRIDKTKAFQIVAFTIIIAVATSWSHRTILSSHHFVFSIDHAWAIVILHRINLKHIELQKEKKTLISKCVGYKHAGNS